MAEPASLKSYGRFQCGQDQMFYELILTQKQYLLKYYNEFGKLKMIRPLKFPIDGLEILTAGNYLFCYLHSFENQVDSQIIITKLDSCLPIFKSCKLHLLCKTATNTAVKLVYLHELSGTFIFADERQNLYILPNEKDPFECKKIYENDKMISRIQVNRDSNIVLITEERHIKILVMDWGSGEVLREVVKKDEVDYYFENGYEVEFIDKQPEIEIPDKPIHLEIRENGEFKYFLKKDSDLIFFSTKKDFLIVFDPKHNIFVTLIEGIFKTYGQQIEDSPIPPQLKENNFMAVYKKDKYRNVLIELRIYNQIKEEFKSYIYNFSDMGKKLSNLSFLKKNIEKVFHFNGLIDPLYEEVVQKALRELEDNASDFDKSRIIQAEGQLNFVDLSCKLMKYGFLYFPKEMVNIVHKVKRHITNIKETYCIVETRRLFEYCEIIHNSMASDLQQISQTRDCIQRNGEMMSSIQSQSNCKAGKFSQILTNMVNFLALLIKELESELHNLRQERLEDHQIDTLLNHLKYYKQVRESSKSLFLIARLLQDLQVHSKIFKAFSTFAEKSEVNFKRWQKHHLRLVKMDYPPLFLHDLFRNISHLTQNPNKKPSFKQFFHYLLENRSNFIEIAYFYQYILKVTSVPFLDTDTSDLLENILIHTQIIPQPFHTQENQDNGSGLRIENLIHKMAGTAIKTGEYFLIKYMIQQSISHKLFPLAVMLIHSQSFRLSKDDPLNEKQHVFMIKSLLLTGKFDLAYLYVLKHYSKDLFEEFVKWAQANGNLSDLLQLKFQKKLIEEDDKSLISLLNITPEQEGSLSSLMEGK